MTRRVGLEDGVSGEPLRMGTAHSADVAVLHAGRLQVAIRDGVRIRGAFDRQYFTPFLEEGISAGLFDAGDVVNRWLPGHFFSQMSGNLCNSSFRREAMFFA